MWILQAEFEKVARILGSASKCWTRGHHSSSHEWGFGNWVVIDVTETTFPIVVWLLFTLFLGEWMSDCYHDNRRTSFQSLAKRQQASEPKSPKLECNKRCHDGSLAVQHTVWGRPTWEVLLFEMWDRTCSNPAQTEWNVILTQGGPLTFDSLLLLLPLCLDISCWTERSSYPPRDHWSCAPGSIRWESCWRQMSKPMSYRIW